MKIRAIRTLITEYEVIPKYYPEGATPEEIIKIDTEGFYEDPELFFENLDKDIFKLEIIED